MGRLEGDLGDMRGKAISSKYVAAFLSPEYQLITQLWICIYIGNVSLDHIIKTLLMSGSMRQV